MERFKEHDPQREKGLNVVRLLPNDQIVLDVRKKKLGVGRISGPAKSTVLVYDLITTDTALEIYQQLKGASESGKLKNVKII